MRIIKNYDKLAVSEARKKVLDIIEAGIKEVHPRNLVKIALKYNETFNSVTVQNNVYDILRGRIFVVGGGKACGLEESSSCQCVNVHFQISCLQDQVKGLAGHPVRYWLSLRGF